MSTVFIDVVDKSRAYDVPVHRQSDVLDGR